jgi:hypothetical protein
VTLSRRRRGPSEQRRIDARRSLREQALEKFGPAADERTTDRRTPKTPAETEAILRQLGIEDRRRTDRRRGL